jgi:hypothetical protein
MQKFYDYWALAKEKMFAFIREMEIKFLSQVCYMLF